MSDQPGPSKPSGEKAKDINSMTLAEYLSLPENQNANIVQPLSWCPHLEAINNHFRVEDYDVKRKCQGCENEGENWICCHCQKVFCSRYVNKCMVLHSDESSHAIALSFSDLSCWCFVCDDYVSNEVMYEMENALHKNKFDGESMPRKDNATATVLELE